VEIWKDIEGYKGIYQVSNYGRVRGLERYVNYKSTGLKRILKEKILKPNVIKGGYLQVKLLKNNTSKCYLVHRLVALNFLENKRDLPQVNHKDENRQNNHLDNLEFCDSQYNNNYGNRNENIRLNHNNQYTKKIKKEGK